MRVPDAELENTTELRLLFSVVTVGKNKKAPVLAINLNEQAISFSKNKIKASFHFPSPQDEGDLIKISPNVLSLDKKKNGEILNKLNQILQVSKMKGKKQLSRPPPEYDKIWLPTPENCQNPDILQPL